jgi:hypothetical protein
MGERSITRPSAERMAYERGAWSAFDRVLNHLNTLDEQRVDKGELYKAIMDMRP